MICVEQPEGTLEVIYQRDHAQQSARLAAHWCQPTWLDDAMWARFVTAVARHDEGWKLAERLPALDTEGRPIPFMHLELDQHLPLIRASMDQVGLDDAYAGLLVALHFREIESRHVQHDPHDALLVQRFIEQADQRIDAALASLRLGGAAVARAIDPAHLAGAQRLLGLLDALSLMLAGGLPWAPMQAVLPIGSQMVPVSVRGDQAVTLDPWPFEQEVIDAPLTVRVLEQTHFETSSDLARALAQAPCQEKMFQLTRG